MTGTDNPLFSLSRLGLAIQQLNKRAEQDFGISLTQWCLLKHLIDLPSVSAHSLARVAGIHPSTLTSALRRLEKKGLVFSAGDPLDSRRKVISLTRAGKAALDKTDRVIVGWLTALTDVECEILKVRAALSESCR